MRGWCVTGELEFYIQIHTQQILIGADGASAHGVIINFKHDILNDHKFECRLNLEPLQLLLAERKEHINTINLWHLSYNLLAPHLFLLK